MTTISHLREAKALFSANRAAEAHKLIEAMIYSLLDAGGDKSISCLLGPFDGEAKARLRAKVRT